MARPDTTPTGFYSEKPAQFERSIRFYVECSEILKLRLGKNHNTCSSTKYVLNSKPKIFLRHLESF